MNQYLVILRGLPGAGKSTHMKRMVRKCYTFVDFSKCETNFGLCSADYYFERPDGVYSWDAKLLGNAHQWCLEQCELSMNEGTKVIFLDNTNMRRKDFQPYVDLAALYGYKVKQVVVGKFDEQSVLEYYRRCIHGVPLETIGRMARKFEL